MSDRRPLPALAVLGTVMCRVVVPLWIILGAVFKLLEGDPGLLPRNTILDFADSVGVDLDVLLATLVSIEFALSLLMIFVARFARPLAIFMLASFCAILVGEIVQGGTSCGCLGANSPSPITMLVTDGLMLMAVLLLKPLPTAGGADRRWPALAAAALALAAAGTSFGMLIPRGEPVAVDPGPGPKTNGEDSPPVDPTVNPSPERLPSYYYASDEAKDGWIGRSWRDVDLFRYMPVWPEGLDEGTRFVVFYGRTCDHCELMFIEDLGPNPDLASRVVTIEVPTEQDRMRPPEAWEMPESKAQLMALPLGPNWILTTPVALRIENGIVRCVKEGDHKECMGLE